MSELHVVDARGLACPQPVLLTKKTLDEQSVSSFKVLLDNETSMENVKRFAGNQGCDVKVKSDGNGEFEVIVTSTGTPKPETEKEELLACPTAQPASDKLVVYIGTRYMGKGDDELGEKLMRGFLRTWIDTTPLPWRMIFINSGVYLTAADEEAVEAIHMLEERGVEVLSCGTCLQHFGLEEQLKVGKVTSMYEVIETMIHAGKVVSPD